MKKNLPNDGLDEFLKKSFEGYEENPSHDVWENISSGLKKETVGSATVDGTRMVFKWWMAAAAGLLLCAGVTQYFYFNNKMDELVQRVDNQGIILDELEKKNEQKHTETSKESLSQNTPTLSEEISNSNIFEKKEIKNSSVVIQTNKLQKKGSNKNLPDVNPQNSASREVNVEKQFRNFIEDFPPRSINDGGNSSFLSDNPSDQNFNNKTEFSETPNENIKSSNKQQPTLPLEQLIADDNFLKIDKDYQFELPTANKIIPISKMKNGISIIPFASYYQSNERIVFNGIARPSPSIPIHHLQNLNGDFAGSIQQFGLKVDFGVKGNWKIETGVAYRSEVFQATHNTLTQFRDRQSGSNCCSAEFSFKLNTGDGLADVNIQTSRESNEPIADNEPILVEIEVERVRTNFSIPLKLNYYSENGSWIFGGGIGLAFNIPIKNELKLNGIVDHEKLDNQIKTPQPQERITSGIGMDAIASLNLGYKLTENLSLEITPSFIYQLKRNQPIDRFVSDINVVSFGSDIGLRYSF